MPADVTMERLDDQIGWYGDRSSWNQRCYKTLKVIVIVVAASIPVLSGLPTDMPEGALLRWVLGVLGALVAIIEGIQQVYQFHTNWISYRATGEALKREKFLYLAKAGPYAAAADSNVLLAERIEALMTQENAKWLSSQEIADKSGTKSPEASTRSPEDSTKPLEESTKSPEDSK
jgi:Protein of unknown function (DUF4231)